MRTSSEEDYLKAGFKGGLKDKKVSVQGLGNVGYHAAKFLQEEDGCRIVCVMEHNGAILNPDGLNVEKIKQYHSEHGSFKGCSEGKFKANTSEFLTMKCDILIPAAREGVINQNNAKRIKTKIIAEAANGPVTYQAEAILIEKGVVIIPDVYLNAGGVTVSYFEWIKNLSHIRFGRMERRYQENQNNLLIKAIEQSGKKLSEKLISEIGKGPVEIDLVRSGLDDTMRNAFQAIRERYWKEEKIKSYRTSAMSMYIEKIFERYNTIGVYP